MWVGSCGVLLLDEVHATPLSRSLVVADCPYNSDNDEDEKKKEKKDRKEKKEKKEKKMTFQKKKKGGGHVVT